MKKKNLIIKCLKKTKKGSENFSIDKVTTYIFFSTITIQSKNKTNTK